MTEPVSMPGSAGDDEPDLPPDRATERALPSWPTPASGSLSDEDVLALLDSLGVAGTHGPEADQEAVAEASWQALQAGEPATDASATFVGEHLPAGPGLAAVLAQDTPGGASDWDLPGMAAGYRRLAAWAQARELAAVAEIAARRAAANQNIGAGPDGRPCQLPPEAAAEVALELRMSQYGASDWTDLGCQLRWRLPATFAALAAGIIDLARTRIIAEGTGLLSDEHAAAVEQRVVPDAGEKTTGQLRAAVRRAVLAVDPDGAEQRRKDTERHAKVGLYPDEEGTATLTGSRLPGIQAAAAMARITAMARALKSAGAGGGLDLLRAHVFISLLLGTLPLIPPPADGPPDNPPPPDDQPPDDDPAPPPDDAPAPPPPDDDPAPPPTDQAPPDEGPVDQAGDSGTPREGTSSDQPCPGGNQPPPADGPPAYDPPSNPAPNPAPQVLTDDDSVGDQPPLANRPPHSPPDNGPAAGEPLASGGPPPDQPPSPAGGPPDQSSELAGRSGDAPGHAVPRSPAGQGAAASDGDPASADLPGWWPDIPWPADADAPPDTGDPPSPIALSSRPDDEDDDWPQLPAPDPPALPARLPAAGDPAAPGDAARSRAGLLDVLLPWSSLADQGREPGTLGRIGPISSLQAQQLLLLATLSPSTEWRVIVTGDDGRALAVERARPPRQAHSSPTDPDSTGVIGRITITIRASTIATTPRAATAQVRACPLPLRQIAANVLRAAARAAARAQALAERDAQAGGCAHTTASAAYRPPPRIREFIAARDKTCRFGPCGQPAWRTDIDHTIPWHRGGLTCRCNLDGNCRTHHLIKHLPGWHLEQPQPGTFRWTTPAGRSYLVTPDPYPV
jgi:hypothetical protein